MVAEIVVNDMVVVESWSVVDIVVADVVVDDMVVVVVESGVVVENVVAIAEATIWWILFLALSLSSIEGHCQSSPLSSTWTSVSCPWPLAMMTDPGADSQKKIERIEYTTVLLILNAESSQSLIAK